jgi:hypothetical protein
VSVAIAGWGLVMRGSVEISDIRLVNSHGIWTLPQHSNTVFINLLVCIRCEEWYWSDGRLERRNMMCLKSLRGRGEHRRTVEELP